MYKSLHLRDGIDKLYVSRKEEGRRLISIKDCVTYQYKHSRMTLEKAKKDLSQEPVTTLQNKTREKKQKIKTRKQKREEKQMYLDFKRQTDEIAHEKTWIWLRKGNLKWESKSLLNAK